MDTRHIQYIRRDPQYKKRLDDIVDHLEHCAQRGEGTKLRHEDISYLMVHIHKLEEELSRMGEYTLSMSSHELFEYNKILHHMNKSIDYEEVEYRERLERRKQKLSWQQDYNHPAPFIKF